MSTAAIEISKAQALNQWKSPAQIKARITAIQQLMDETLKEDVDYGVIPGMPKGTKPSLWKAGSEQILSMFQIAVDPVVEDLSTEDCCRYRVTCRLTNAATGDFLGAGIGEASTNETKYKWRRTFVKKEFDNTPEDRRRIKYSQYNENGVWKDKEEMQVRQEPADLANTILKMAKKRAQIDATLTVTAASSMFEQDLEDLTDETREEFSRQRQPKGKKGQAKATPKETGDVICASCGSKNGHTPECQYRKLCPECNGPGGKHATGCSKAGEAQAEETKPAEEEKAEKPKLTKWLIQVDAVDERTRTETDKAGKEKKRQYLIVSGFNAANQQVTLYCWHTGEMAARVKAIPAKTRCIFMVKETMSGNTVYHQIEEIVEITGEKRDQGAMFPPQE